MFRKNFPKLEENFAKHQIKILQNFREITKMKIFVTTLVATTVPEFLSDEVERRKKQKWTESETIITILPKVVGTVWRKDEKWI